MHQPQRLTHRREFLKTAGLGIGGLILASQLSSAPTILPGRKKRAGIALVGLGYYSTDELAPALQQTEFAYLAGIVTGSPQKVERWQRLYGIPDANVYNYDNFDSIRNNGDIDIVYVVLPNSMHKEFTIRAAQAGKHVICEKPMALNANDCREMIAACKANGVGLSIGYRMQYEPHTQEIMRLGQEQVFGPVYQVSAGAGYRSVPSQHWKWRKAMGGGAMMDMGVYPLQAARYVTGKEPIRVSAQTFTTRDVAIEVDEVTTFQLEFEGGIIANLETSFHANSNYLHAFAENGYFQLQPFSSYRGIRGSTSHGPLEFPAVNQQATQMDEDAKNMLAGKPVRVPGEEGLADMIVVDAVKESIRTGRKVML
ncbi:MAG: Gfo/Idh/MocA family oxidoreductase [Puniceicoccaceae bacterium]